MVSLKLKYFLAMISAVSLTLFWFASATAQSILSGDRSIPLEAKNGMVVTSHPLASQAALDVLKKGGNAIDAAVTAAFTLAVVQPRSGNIGGGGFMLIALEDKAEVVAIDYREKAPAAARREMFLNEQGEVDKQKSRFSHQAVGVPGTVAGLDLALKKYGTRSWAATLAPAIELAAQGFVVTPRFTQGIKRRAKQLIRHPASRRLFFKAEGQFYQPGERFIQKNLAATLRRIAKQGAQEFYTGKTADLIVAEMAQGQGLITKADLKHYRPVVRQPIHGTYRGYDLYAMSPPSSGGIHIVQILNILESYPIATFGHNSAQTIHLMAEAMKRAYADRSQHLGDSDFVRVPLKGLASKAYARQLGQTIDPAKASPSETIQPGQPVPYESNETTHFSIVDQWGNSVANTYTINFSYGSHIAVTGAGFLLNNEMDDFSAKPGVANAYGLLGGEANKIAPEKRMLSSMSPTIVKKGGKNVLVTGSPGGSRIITTTLQVIMNVIDHGLNVQAAVNAPRIHHQWFPDEIRIEQGISPDTIQRLEAMGHQVKQKRAMGASQTIMIGEDGMRYGGADPRRRTSSALGF